MSTTHLYRGSFANARASNEAALWRASHQANVACKKAIEACIRQQFDGMHLPEDSAREVLRTFGFKRVNWVLANTIREKSWDGRFSRENKDWSRRIPIPDDPGHNLEFVVGSHPAVLNGFVDQVRQAYEALNLFGPQHCQPNSRSELDYDGKVLVLSPDTLKEVCWSQENQLWYAHDGFGCRPHAIGRSVRCTCLGDGETTRWNRVDFVGVLKEEFLPEWARERLEQLAGTKRQENTVSHSEEMRML